MYTMPIALNPQEYTLFVILEDENLERMRENDPAIVHPKKMGSPFTQMKCKEIILCAPKYEDAAKVLSLLRAGEQRQAVMLLMSGFRYRPDRGDSDLPYRSALKEDS